MITIYIWKREKVQPTFKSNSTANEWRVFVFVGIKFHSFKMSVIEKWHGMKNLFLAKSIFNEMCLFSLNKWKYLYICLLSVQTTGILGFNGTMAVTSERFDVGRFYKI